MKIKDFKKIKLPNKPGVYFFVKNHSEEKASVESLKGEVLYIGRATSLRDRVKSYFGKDLIETRGPMLLDMVTLSKSIKWQETDSVLEAVILEANLIKKYQPKYNTKEKDNKSFNYVCITKEEVPKVLIKRGRNLNKEEYDSIYGPFPNGLQLREAMKIIRRIFPYVDDQSSKKNNREFYKQLGLVPEIGKAPQKHPNSPRFTPKEPYTDKNLDVSVSREYNHNIKNLKLFFEGKKKNILINLKKEMMSFAKKKEFEKADVIKKRIFTLNHINDVSLIKGEIFASQNNLNFPRFTPEGPYTDKNLNNSASQIKLQNFRVEAYDIAHLGGKNMVGVMVVMENGELINSEYRKFIIKTQDSANDTGALEEVLSRRFRHTEWGLPDVVVMDGGIAQINIAKLVLSRYQFKIPVVSVVKDDKHKAKAIMGDELIINKCKKEILLINNESHRFAIAFHKKKRNSNFLK